MAREESVLFPYLRVLADPEQSAPAPGFCTVRNPVRMLMMQHDHAAELLGELQEASHDFTPPADACASYCALYAALADLRLDLLKHVSLENNVLFPCGIALEDAILRRRAASADRSPVVVHALRASLR
jgi:regulator of cell morphogenesis and NO signaling